MIEIAKEAAVKAGDFLFSNRDSIGTVKEKEDKSLVTNLDEEAEELITSILKKEFPAHGIIGEEEKDNSLAGDYIWIIDPLDGTHNFIRGIEIFGVSIGLWYKDDFVLGVVYMPYSKELYYGQKGKGAYKNGNKISVSSITDMSKASCSFDSSIKKTPEVMLKTLKDVIKETFNLRMLGSSARLLSYVAEGKLDFAIEFHDKPWDFAGSVCIIKEAGGFFSDLKGDNPSPETTGYFTGNKKLYSDIKSILDRNL
jgi:myo-inositol-1(or 4)-monophosphatase